MTPVQDEFRILPWANLTQHPEMASSIGEARVDMHVHETDEDITVYARRHMLEPPPGAVVDPKDGKIWDAPEAWQQQVIPPPSCSGAGYRNVGGQPAQGHDLIGYGSNAC